MRGQRNDNRGLKSGRTIVAERERAESESDRMQARRKAHRKHMTSIVIIVLMAAILVLTIYLGGKEMSNQNRVIPSVEEGNKVEETKITAEVVDEEGSERLSGRMREFVAQLEQDFREEGYLVKRVTLPTGKSHEVYVDLDGEEIYFRISIDRSPAVSAEDAKRVLKYLHERDLHPKYVDLRVEGKAFYQ